MASFARHPIKTLVTSVSMSCVFPCVVNCGDYHQNRRHYIQHRNKGNLTTKQHDIIGSQSDVLGLNSTTCMSHRPRPTYQKHLSRIPNELRMNKGYQQFQKQKCVNGLSDKCSEIDESDDEVKSIYSECFPRTLNERRRMKLAHFQKNARDPFAKSVVHSHVEPDIPGLNYRNYRDSLGDRKNKARPLVNVNHEQILDYSDIVENDDVESPTYGPNYHRNIRRIKNSTSTTCTSLSSLQNETGISSENVKSHNVSYLKKSTKHDGVKTLREDVTSSKESVQTLSFSTPTNNSSGTIIESLGFTDTQKDFMNTHGGLCTVHRDVFQTQSCTGFTGNNVQSNVNNNDVDNVVNYDTNTQGNDDDNPPTIRSSRSSVDTSKSPMALTQYTRINMDKTRHRYLRQERVKHTVYALC